MKDASPPRAWFELNGQIEGELHGKSLIISRGALVKGAVSADQVVVDGTIEGPIRGGEIILKSRAHVIGDIHHQSLSIENGASFEGRSVHTGGAKGNVTQLRKRRHSQPARSLERRRIREQRLAGSTRSTASMILDASLEVRSPIIYATLIIVLAVVPVFFMSGLAGAFFQPLAVSYAIALLASMLVALTVMPALCLMLLDRVALERRRSP